MSLDKDANFFGTLHISSLKLQRNDRTYHVHVSHSHCEHGLDQPLLIQIFTRTYLYFSSCFFTAATTFLCISLLQLPTTPLFFSSLGPCPKSSLAPYMSVTTPPASSRRSVPAAWSQMNSTYVEPGFAGRRRYTSASPLESTAYLHWLSMRSGGAVMPTEWDRVRHIGHISLLAWSRYEFGGKKASS